MTKTLVLYVYHEWNKRVEYFIEHAVFQDNNRDFIIIANTLIYEKTPTPIPLPSYVKTLYRENKGYDFGGWSDAILQNDDYKNYDYFIFANSSIIGPFLKPDQQGPWTNIYINGLKDNVKLFGSTINTLNEPTVKSHVQSYIYAVNRETLDYLISEKIFTTQQYTNTLCETINEKEIGMSQKIIKNGWNIGSLDGQYTGVDFTFKTKSPSEYNIAFLLDIMTNDSRNKLWTDYDVVFIKGNRMNDWIDSIASTIHPYRKFLEWLVTTKNPDVIVDLGVDYGYSTFVFANALRLCKNKIQANTPDLNCEALEDVKKTNSIVYGVDYFRGDEQTGFRDTYNDAIKIATKNYVDNLSIIRGDFTDIASIWSKPIDILHIDGLHTYEAVKRDFESWSKYVKDEGIILFHCTEIDYFGVNKFFKEELTKGNKLYFKQDCGMGIYTKNQKVYEKIKAHFENVHEIQ